MSESRPHVAYSPTPVSFSAPSARYKGESELDQCTPRRWPGRSGVYMQSADSCEEDPDEPQLDASIEELDEARVSAQLLVSELLPTFAPQTRDEVVATSVDIADLVVSTALSTDARDANPDPRLFVSGKVLHRYFTRSQTRAGVALSHARASTGSRKRPVDSTSPGSHADPGLSHDSTSIHLHKRQKRSPGPPPDFDVSSEALPPRIDYSLHHLAGPSSPVDHNFRLSCPSPVVHVPVAFTLDRLCYDRKMASDIPAVPPPQLPAFPVLAKKRKPRLCDLGRTARRNLQRTTAVVAPLRPSITGATQAPAFESTNVTKTGNHGFIPRWRRDAVRAAYGTPRLVNLLETMHLVPYNFDTETDTAVCDRNGRCITFRSKVVADIRPGESLIDKLNHEVQLFVANCPISASDRDANKRGDHFFAIMGIHRQYSEPYETSFHRKYRKEVNWLMSPGSALSRYTLLLTILIERRFPNLAERMLNNAKWHYDHSKIDGKPLLPQFGLFWNCCINAPSPEGGLDRVVTAPHADSKNVAALFCALLPFWADDLVDEDEWSWLVLWDLGIILQCPRGAFVLYPSALLLHFNVRIVKCKRGEHPTPENSTELPVCVRGGRGSIVWYCQASMFTCTEEGKDGQTHEERVKDFIPVVLHPSAFDEDYL